MPFVVCLLHSDQALKTSQDTIGAAPLNTHLLLLMPEAPPLELKPFGINNNDN